MAFDYESKARSALRIIEKFGAEYPLTRSNDDYDSDTGAVTENAPFGGEIKAVMLPIPKGTNRYENFAEDLAKGNIRYLLAAASGAPFEPVSGDILTIKNERWEVIGCSPLAPDGVTAIIYEIDVRRA